MITPERYVEIRALADIAEFIHHVAMPRMSEAGVKRMLWVGDACNALLDYRNPGHVITTAERHGLAEYQDLGYSPSDAADAYQAKTAA